MKLITGLGNPGIEYKETRHNIGFLTVEHICSRENISLQRKKFNCLFGSGVIAGYKVIAALPQTYMNRSGEPVRSVISYYDISVSDLVVIHDDMDLEPGTFKIKTAGGSAGHKGIASLIRHLNTDHFTRIRVGIGKPPAGIPSADYVLNRFSKDETAVLKEVIENIEDCINLIFTKGAEHAMNRFHGIKKTSP